MNRPVKFRQFLLDRYQRLNFFVGQVVDLLLLLGCKIVAALEYSLILKQVVIGRHHYPSLLARKVQLQPGDYTHSCVYEP
jgi:hypothetical protein